jgi:hypothetical protein
MSNLRVGDRPAPSILLIDDEISARITGKGRANWPMAMQAMRFRGQRAGDRAAASSRLDRAEFFPDSSFKRLRRLGNTDLACCN